LAIRFREIRARICWKSEDGKNGLMGEFCLIFSIKPFSDSSDLMEFELGEAQTPP